MGGWGFGFGGAGEDFSSLASSLAPGRAQWRAAPRRYRVLPEGVVEPYGGAPTASIVAQEAVANALVRALADHIAFDPTRFRRNHPGGALGESLK